MGQSASVPYGTDSFVAFGGRDSSAVYADSVVEYLPQTKGWRIRPEKLSRGVVWGLPVIVPPDVAPCA